MERRRHFVWAVHVVVQQEKILQGCLKILRFDLALGIKCCRILCVHMGKQPRHCKIHCKSPQKGKTERERGEESFWCDGGEDHAICNAGDVINNYCMCALPLTWHWKTLINLRNKDLCSRYLESNHFCIYHKFGIKYFGVFLRAMGLEHVGKIFLLMPSSVSEMYGKGIIACSYKVIFCTQLERWCN